MQEPQHTATHPLMAGAATQEACEQKHRTAHQNDSANTQAKRRRAARSTQSNRKGVKRKKRAAHSSRKAHFSSDAKDAHQEPASTQVQAHADADRLLIATSEVLLPYLWTALDTWAMQDFMTSSTQTQHPTWQAKSRSAQRHLREACAVLWDETFYLPRVGTDFRAHITPQQVLDREPDDAHSGQYVCYRPRWLLLHDKTDYAARIRSQNTHLTRSAQLEPFVQLVQHANTQVRFAPAISEGEYHGRLYIEPGVLVLTFRFANIAGQLHATKGL